MIIDLGPLTIKVDVLIVQLINLAILFWIFKKLFGDTLVKEIAKRKEMTIKLEQAHKEYDALIAQAHEEKDVLLKSGLAEKSRILEEAKELAIQEKQHIIHKAEQQAESIIDKAKSDAKLQARDLNDNFIQGVKNTSFALVKKLFGNSAETQQTYLNGLVEEFSKSYNAR